MWGQAGKWLQEKAHEVAAKAEEVRQGQLVQGLEAHGKTLIQGIVAASSKITEQEALYHARLTPVTDRLVGMAFPEPLEAVARLLGGRYKGRYMVWNLSEEAYDYSKFDNQVLEYRFPGHPAPPLGLMVKIALAVENWLQADEKNVAVIHCLTGKGRTATVLSALLCWLDVDVGQGPGGQTATTMQALQFVSEKMGMDPDKATIPSQRRYLEYFNLMLEGVKPRPEPLLLRRVIMNTIPRFGAPPPGEGADAAADGSQSGSGSGGPLGCCPYLQLFKGGKLIFTAPCSRDGSSMALSSPQGAQQQPLSSSKTLAAGAAALPWALQSDGSIAFNVDCPVQGDVLLRVRHLAAGGQKISMCRAAFHTGYVPHGVLRLSKSQLDGACLDARFDQDFFMDLIFAPANADVDSLLPSPSPPPATAAAEEKGGGGGAGVVNSAQQRRELGLAQDVADRDNYDAMLHSDTRFWNEIAARKRRAAARARKEKERARLLKEQGGQQPPSSSSAPSPQPLQPAFSILEGGDMDTADPNESLIVFDATPSAALPTPELPPLSLSSSTHSHLLRGGSGGGSTAGLLAGMNLLEDDLLLGGMEDPSHHREDAAGADELIRELQAATAAIDIGGSSSTAPASAAQAPAAPAPAPAPAVAEAEAKPPSASVASTSTDAVLSALDGLEQELGLGDLSSSLLATTTAGAGAGAAPAGAATAPQQQAAGAGAGGGLEGLDDNLEEFESFLESLESSGGGGGNKAAK